MLLTLPPTRGEEAATPPAPELVALERVLAKNQRDRESGQLTPEQYKAFAAQFRVDLAGTLSHVPPTPANKGLHAQILSRLGEEERGQALNTLTQAIAANPGSPDLIRAKGQILYEQGNYPAAAEAARQAWEASGGRDKSALGLLKMSQGRGAPKFVSGASPTALVTPGSANREMSPQAMSFVQKSIEARKRGDMATTWANAQAAMNADPTSPGVQKFYEIVKADVQQSSHRVDVISSAPITDPEPKHDSPLLPLLAAGGVGLTALGLYKVSLSRGTTSSEEGLNPSAEVSPEQARRNYLNSVVLIGAPIVIGALVFGGPRLWHTLGPTVGGALRGGQESFQRVATSQAGSLLPEEQAAGEKVSTLQKLPWNSWAQYPKEMVNGREYAKIGERLYTQHAVQRMMPSSLTEGARIEGRSFSPTFVEDIIVRGSVRSQLVDGVPRTLYRIGDAEVVTENAGHLVISVNPYKYKTP